jgi:hypothetical protein
MMTSPIIADNVVTVKPTVGNETISGINDVLLSIIVAAKLKNIDLNII